MGARTRVFVSVSRKKKEQKDAAATANDPYDAIVSTHKYHDRADSEGTSSTCFALSLAPHNAQRLMFVGGFLFDRLVLWFISINGSMCLLKFGRVYALGRRGSVCICC